MQKSLYLINPRSETPTYYGAEVFAHWGFEPAQGIADLATATVAALAPADWDVALCEEYVEPVDFDRPADFIGLTAKVTQVKRMIAIADEFRRRGKVVVMGGPFASLSPDVLRDHCDVLVIGELESIAAELFGDLESGSWRAEYRGDRPELDTSPLPRWELYRNERALEGCVQTSRGCPFECEFCDVIQYLGRNQRHKPIERVIAELDQQYELGYRGVFLADDNLTVHRKHAKELLARIRDWNLERPDGPVAFNSQVSIDTARDPELVELMAEAGLVTVFIGIETPNEGSLKESKKRQNLGIDLIEEVEVFLEHGIAVTGGMIVGFDADGPGIFETQFRFAMASPIPFFSLGALVAPPATPLHARMAREDRLVTGDEVAGTPWSTNLVPNGMSREELMEGLRWLCNRLYRPQSFARRVVRMIEALGSGRGPFAPERGLEPKRNQRPINAQALTLLKKLVRSGKDELEMWRTVNAAIAAKPEAGPAAMRMLYHYAQVRCLYDVGSFWEPHVAAESPVAAG